MCVCAHTCLFVRVCVRESESESEREREREREGEGEGEGESESESESESVCVCVCVFLRRGALCVESCCAPSVTVLTHGCCLGYRNNGNGA